MPYIAKDARERLAGGAAVEKPGELNYAISRICDRYLASRGLSYQVINDVVGALECAKQEFYRRVAAPYEDRKIRENGDVYTAGSGS